MNTWSFSFIMINYNITQNWFYYFNISGFGNYFIHFTPPCFLDVFRLTVTGTRHNHGLQYTLTPTEVPYLDSCLISVHEWHTAVHNYETIRMGLFFVGFLNYVHCLQTIIGFIDIGFDIGVAALLHNCRHANDIIWLIIHDDYSFDLVNIRIYYHAIYLGILIRLIRLIRHGAFIKAFERKRLYF